MSAVVREVLTGVVRPLGRTTSGIDKQRREGPQHVDTLGIVGDEQADQRVHGGPDKAVLCYAWTHYPTWREQLPTCALLDAPGAFGENLSVEGLDERQVHLGDRFRIGSALFEVSQGRQPCFKLNLRFGVADMSTRVQESLRTGWYLRVLEPGTVAAGDTITLAERPHPSHTIADLLAAIRDREVRAEVLDPILALPLAQSWRALFERRRRSGSVEQWTRRLQGE